MNRGMWNLPGLPGPWTAGEATGHPPDLPTGPPPLGKHCLRKRGRSFHSPLDGAPLPDPPAPPTAPTSPTATA